MDKTRRSSTGFDRLQNFLIVFLSLSALLLFLQTPLFGTASERSMSERLEHLFSPGRTDESPSQAELSALSAPVRIYFANGFSHQGADALTITDSDFSRAGTFLGEALGSASEIAALSETDLLSALNENGLYFDFLSGLPLPVLCSTLGVASPRAEELLVRRAFLCADSAAGVRLYLLDRSGACYLFSTALKASELSELLSSLEGSPAELALSRPFEYGVLSPFTLIMDTPSPRSVLSAETPVGSAELSTLLRLAEFNPHTENTYTESSGTIVVRESYGTLTLAPDGTLAYHGGTQSAGELYTVPSERDAVSLNDAVSAAQKLVVTLLHGRAGAASVYLYTAEPTERGYDITFDYIVDGTPLRFSDGSHAATVTIEGRSITAFTIRLRSYTLTDTQSLLLPMRQAAAITQSIQSVAARSELSIAYVDTDSDTVSASWITD